MILKSLSVADFRGYREMSVELPGRLTVLAGDNAQGKTNFLRAVETLGLGDAQTLAAGEAVRFGASRAVIEGRLEGSGGYEDRLAVGLDRPVEGGRGERVRLALNGKAVPRSRWIGRLPVLFVGPEDRDQVTGPPSARRALLDELLEQCEPEYLAALREYRRALRQRNRALTRPEATEDEIEIWEEPMARSGSVLLAHRLRAVSALGPRAAAWHRELTGGTGEAGGLSIEYVSEALARSGGESPAELARSLAESFTLARAHERAAGTTLTGPHRDEVAISAAGRLIKGCGSSGEIWSAILALALASAEHLGGRLGILPILLLDDVLTALDAGRRERLIGVLAGMPQAMLTTTNRPESTADGAVTVFWVAGHAIARTPASPAPAGATEGVRWEPDRGTLARC